MKEHKNKILVVFICVFFISLGLTIAVGFSNQQEPIMLVKNVTPVYDEESGVIVNNDGVIFNDKDQEVKYNVVIENPNNYDVKVSDIVLSTPTEEFLEYEIENFNKDDVIESNDTKELEVTFKTVKKEGWGRNFSDELIANISFAKVAKLEEPKPTPEPEVDKEEEKKEEIKEETKDELEVEKEPIVEEPSQKEELEQEVVVPDEDLVNNVEDNKNDENVKVDSKDKKNNSALIMVLGSITVVSGLIIIIIIVKDKKKKTAALMFVLLSGITLVNADELIELPLTFKVGFESQNVMKPSGWVFDEQGQPLEFGTDYWSFNPQIININIKNDIDIPKVFDYEYDVTSEGNGRVKAYLIEIENEECFTLEGTSGPCFELELQADGIIYPNENASYYFVAMLGLKSIKNFVGMDTSNVTNMEGMFFATGNGNSEINLDLSSLNTGNVTNMKSMFQLYGSNAEELNIDLSNFDTSKVTNMNSMFYMVGYESKKLDINLSSFDTSNVTDMNTMFGEFGRNTEELILDLSSFDTSKVTDMKSMFFNAGNNSKKVNIDISKFDTSNVTDMSSMFEDAGYNATNFSLDVSNFDTSNVTNMSHMFDNVGSASSDIVLNVSKFNTSKVTDMSYMFEGVGQSNTDFKLDVSSFDTSNVTDMSYMFYGTGSNSPNFQLDLSGFDTSKVEKMVYTFGYFAKNSTKLNTSITIRNPNVDYRGIFQDVANKEGSLFIVNYTSKTSVIVERMIANTSNSTIVKKGEHVKNVVDDIEIGDEINIADEKFNIIAFDNDSVTLFARYNLGTDFKQSMLPNYVSFSTVGGWEYTPGPKEIDKTYWSDELKDYMDNYLSYLENKTKFETLSIDLITGKQLINLVCRFNDDYSSSFAFDCRGNYDPWLINTQKTWTKSAFSSAADTIIYNNDNGLISWTKYDAGTAGIRPTVTISMDEFKKLG